MYWLDACSHSDTREPLQSMAHDLAFGGKPAAKLKAVGGPSRTRDGTPSV